MYDLIIIGSGPAGLAAAIYGKRAGLNLLVLEKAPMSGGQILNAHEVDNYPGLPGINGFDLGQQLRDHAQQLGTDFAEGEVEAVEDLGDRKLVRVSGKELEAKTVILATGASNAKLNVPGEEAFVGRGVSYCATCDGAFFRKKTVAVIGGGDVALSDAAYLSAICEKVYLIHRRDRFRGADALQDKVIHAENVEILYHTVTEEICGSDRVESIRVQNTKSGEQREIPVSGVFIAVGTRPGTELVQKLVKLDEKGYVVAGEDCATKVPGLYAAGDIRKKPMRQVITAAADGANAAVSAAEYIRKE